MNPVVSSADLVLRSEKSAMRAGFFRRTVLLVVLPLLLVWAGRSAEAQTVVQSNSVFATNGGNPVVAFPGNNTAGNLLWVAVGSTGAIAAPTDTLGNVYTLAASVTGSSGSGNAAIYYVASAKAGSNSVTCHHSGQGDLHCQIAEISGLVTTSPLDATGGLASSSTCSVATSATTTQAQEWVAAFFYDAARPASLAAGSGYSGLQLSVNNITSGNAGLSESRVIAATGTQAASCTGNSADLLSQLITTFKAQSVSSAPAISSVSPTLGAVGTAVVIAGTNFGATQGTSTVTFNGIAGTPTSWSNTSIAVPVPNGATTGNIVVTVGGKASNGVNFTVAPRINSLEPNSGAVGSQVGIEGANFGAAQGTSTVAISGTAPTIKSWTSTRIVVVIPTGMTSGNAVVTVGGRASNSVPFTVTPPPAITGVSPAEGVAGTQVIITGTNLGSAQGTLGEVTFGGVPCNCAPTWSNTSIRAVVPAGARTGNLVVTAPGSVTSNGLLFSVPPLITQLSPAAGVAGTTLTITGTEFGASQGTSTMTLGGIALTPTSWSDTSIVTSVPSGASAGNVVVTVGGLASSGVLFSVIPGITSITPTSGATGTVITINGTAFGPDPGNSTITFNGVPATPLSWSNTHITVPVPNGATAGNVVVTVSGQASNGMNFTPTLGIGSETPSSGPVGTVVTIKGTAFGATQGTSTVSFNGTPAVPTSWSSGQIVVPVPNSAATGNVVVAVGGVASNGLNFTVTPGIISLSPASGIAGTVVNIAGTNFGAAQGSSTVTFNGTAATPLSWTNTNISVPVPSGATTGNVIVTVGGLASNGVSFTTTLGIGSEAPSAGPVGTQVTISGTGFGATQGTSTVKFNGTVASPTSWSNGKIVVPVPSGATTGNLVVTVGGTASNSLTFTVTPKIISLSTGFGTAGTVVTITGTSFGATQGSSTITFNGTTAAPSSWSDSQIVTPSPGGAGTGYVVVTVAGNASNGVNFTASPGVNSVSPSSGAAGTMVTITGSNFGVTQGSSTVTFGHTLATPVTWSDTSISTQVPSGISPGNVVVTVAGIPSNGISFTPTLGINSESPSAGPVGTLVTITGTGFGAVQGASTITFNGTPATPGNWSDGQIVAPVPSGANTGNIVVTVNGSASNGLSFTVTPTVSNLSPASGPIGTPVTITGANFGSTQGASTVTFNGVAAAPTSWNNGTIVVPVPSGATAGNVVVTVGGNSSNGANFTTTLGIGSESPVSGPVGTLVTISGTGFGSTQGISTVTFNGQTATPMNWSDTSIAVPVPSGASSGNLVVRVGGAASNGVNFNVTTIPVVQSNSGFGTGVLSTSVPFLSNNAAGNLLWVAVGSGGTITPPTDTLGNTYLLAATAGNAAIYYAANAKAGANTVTCNQSARADLHCHIVEIASFGSVSLLDQSGSIASSSSCSVSTAGATIQPNEWIGAFFYDSSAGPVLTAGTGYNLLQLSNNTSGDAALSLSATATSSGPQTASCGGNSSAPLSQLITTFQTGPIVSGLSPSSGPVGSSVVISGSHFGATQGTGTVAFNGMAANITSWNASSITAVLPAGASTGNVSVTVAGATSAGMPFTVISPPTISTLAPSSGPIGSSVVIAGSNFGATQNGSTVTFNGVGAALTSWSNTNITAVVPAGAASGNVVVTMAGGVASAGVPYTVVSSPSITSLTPSTGAVGSSVTIAGTNFGTIQGNGKVTFNGTPVSLLQWSNTSIAVAVPAGATSGNVVVTASGGVSSPGVNFTVLPAPVVNSLSPTTGPVGTQVTIAGNNFGATQSTSTVTFNGVAAAARGRLAVSWSNTSIVVNVPSGATSGNVVVTVGGNASNAVVFGVGTYIANLSPSFGPAGTLVSVNGSGFGGSQGTSTVTFNGTTVTPTNWSNSSIVVPVPSGVTTGNVVVTVGGVASNGVLFTAAPVISSLSASTLAVGSPLTITGLNFGPSPGTVSFNGTPGQPSSWSSTSIVVPVPIGATPGNVVVTANGMTSNGVNFTPGPFISALSLTTAAVGTPITITGGNFGASQGGSTITFNGLGGVPSSWSNTQIVVPVPLGATPGNVVVTVNGLATNPVNFVPGPSLSNLSPNSGIVGTTVTINGVNFGGAQGTSTVTFNGAPATSITQWNNTQIIVVVPTAASTGNVVVKVNGQASNALTFTVVPNITSLLPNSGAVGSVITITGTAFGSTAGTVTFNGTPALVSGWSNNTVNATVPPGATSGNVVVTSSSGSSSAGVGFTVVAPPAITNLSVNSGPIGISVTITGNNFGTLQSNAGVTFNGTPATAISNWTNTSITATVPSSATTGNVVVVAAGGVASAGVNFTVVDPSNPPAISATNPFTLAPPLSKPGTLGTPINSGPAQMGFYINGSNFGKTQGDSTVTIGGVPFAKIIKWSSTQILVQAPATGGTVVVTVGKNPGTSTTQNPTFSITDALGCDAPN